MKKYLTITSNVRRLLIASALLLLFGAAGQIDCDLLGYEQLFPHYALTNLLPALGVILALINRQGKAAKAADKQVNILVLYNDNHIT